MSARQARFEVVHTGPTQFHARFRAANGEIVWTTETYKRRRAAVASIALIAGTQVMREGDELAVWAPFSTGADTLEVREVDER